jgi:DNA-binding MarR family transcriptional regulator
MPGARLTHEDRRQIAAWMADGLGYAEIARRLGRPTSTISREVARNGEPGHYLPDRAQHAAARRGRRRRDRTTQPWPDGRPAEPVRAFVDQFAALLAETGLPRMASRVFVCLLTSDSGSLTAADLVRRLQVSPASVSKSIGYLERMDLIARKPDAGGRRERYAIVDDVWLRAWRTDTSAHARVAEAAQRGTEIFGAGTPAGGRLGTMGRFFTWLSGQMSDSDLAEPTVISMTLAVPDTAAAARWYAQALGATELCNRDGVVGLTVGGAPFFLDRPEHNGWATPAAGTRTTRVEVFVDDPDAFIGRAVAAGADGSVAEIRGRRAPREGFLDPFGHLWLVSDRCALNRQEAVR